MRSIRSKDTWIERLVRSKLRQDRFGYRKNYRFSVMYQGKRIRPEADIYLSRYEAVVLVNGCYWHHHGCRLSKKPLDAMKPFWRKKLGENVVRDRRNTDAYNSIGLKVMCVWECSLRDRSNREIDYVVRQLEDWIRFGIGNASIP
jgi:DNA mismatch endonuclease (patch repair protein)